MLISKEDTSTEQEELLHLLFIAERFTLTQHWERGAHEPEGLFIYVTSQRRSQEAAGGSSASEPLFSLRVPPDPWIAVTGADRP